MQRGASKAGGLTHAGCMHVALPHKSSLYSPRAQGCLRLPWPEAAACTAAPCALRAVCARSNISRDRGPRALLEAVGSVVVLFCLSWRLAPVCSFVIIAAAVGAAVFRKHTREIESQQGRALQRMTAVALQALDNMRIVR